VGLPLGGVTRKDYVEVARILREADLSDEQRARLVARFVTFFADDNPRFSPTRFRDAVLETTQGPEGPREV
jgi:hypothetical protein